MKQAKHGLDHTHSAVGSKSKALILCLCIFAVLSILLVGCTQQDQTTNTPATSADNAKEPTTIKSVVSGALSQYSGNVLAGNKTPYIEFNSKDYQKATEDGKVILLYFYSDNSPVSKTEEVRLLKAFNDMSSEKMIGFRVHYDDDLTTDVEKQLAETLGAKEAHTKLIMKDGKVLQKNVNTWDITDFEMQMGQYLNN